MANVNELKTSKFLKKEDVGDGVLVTIREVTKHNIAIDGAPEDQKYCMTFEELDKPLVLNSTNGQLIAKITGEQEMDDWSGKKIVLYTDDNVSFQGKLVGGIRVRAPKDKGKELPF
jgi:hypothetical protein